MKLKSNTLLLENKKSILENLKQGKLYVDQGKLSNEELEALVKIDPTPTRKFVGWLAKIWMTEHPDIDDLRNTIEEYDTFLNKNKAKTKDIYTFKSFKDLKSEVDTLNHSGEGVSVKDLESDYETIMDTPDLLIMSPHTHEASRKLGLSHFSYRPCGDGQDSAWCTTYKTPDHFNSYYYSNNVTFYYIKIKSEQLLKKLKEAFPNKWERMVVMALAVLDNGKIDGYDGTDKQLNKNEIKAYTDVIGIS